MHAAIVLLIGTGVVTKIFGNATMAVASTLGARSTSLLGGRHGTDMFWLGLSHGDVDGLSTALGPSLAHLVSQ